MAIFCSTNYDVSDFSAQLFFAKKELLKKLEIRKFSIQKNLPFFIIIHKNIDHFLPLPRPITLHIRFPAILSIFNCIAHPLPGPRFSRTTLIVGRE